MKERPIIINTEMVKAILDGRKTQTRRIIKPQPISVERCVELTGSTYSIFTDRSVPDGWRVLGPCGVILKESKIVDNGMYTWKCPYGKIGDRLWVRETWFSYPTYDNLKPSKINHTESIESMQENDIDYLVSPIPYYNRGKKRPSIFMPRWASRIDLEITDIRVERVQDITNEDIQAEGVQIPMKDGLVLIDLTNGVTDYLRDIKSHFHTTAYSIKELLTAYMAHLWDSINAKRGYGWEINPWVWVITFKKL